MAEWNIEALADDHERVAFSCGKLPLDVFLRTQAGQYARKDIGQTFVAVRPASRVVIGYYTIAASALDYASFPVALVKRLPKHPVPTVLLGRLAVDTSAHGEGIGSDLLADALRRVLRLADELGVFAVHVHAIDEDAVAFYTRFEFVALSDQERHLLLPVATLRRGDRKAANWS